MESKNQIKKRKERIEHQHQEGEDIEMEDNNNIQTEQRKILKVKKQRI